MCGRLDVEPRTWTQIYDAYRAFLDAMIEKDIEKGDDEWEEWDGNINLAPTTPVPVLRYVGGKPHINLMRWGLVPAWSKEIGKFATFNARADTVHEKPTFRGAWKAGRRCIIAANHFYEWRKPDKQPFAIGLGNKGPMAMAGLWEEWKPKDGKPLLSCTIITTEANSLMSPLHDRMPVILDDTDIAKWLGAESASNDEIGALLRPFASERMRVWPVSKDVNNVRNKAATLLDPVEAA